MSRTRGAVSRNVVRRVSLGRPFATRVLALAVATAVVGAGGVARANGRYPAATLIAFDPVDPRHFVLSATFGLVESRDGGKTFRWDCESALGAMGAEDLVVAITASGATVT